jgi:hypothetical protein
MARSLHSFWRCAGALIFDDCFSPESSLFAQRSAVSHAGGCAQAVFSDGTARWNVEASSRIASPAPALCCRDWFGGLQNLALTARMKAEAFPTLEIFLSTIFLSNL